MSQRSEVEAPRTPLLTSQGARSAAWQAILLAALIWLVWSAIDNAARNMRARGIPTDFDFWNRTAGFDINATLIPFSAANNTYGDAFYVGLLNTLVVAACGIVLATIVGFLVGVARLSQNWMIGRLAGGYIEIIRNTPLLLQLLFWYNAVLTPLPGPRQSIALPGGSWINNRGLFLPDPHFGPGAGYAFAAFGAGVLGDDHSCATLQAPPPCNRERPSGAVAFAGADRRPAAARLRDRRRAGHVHLSRVARLQFRRRHAGLSRIRGAAARTVALHGGVHRGNRAGRASCRFRAGKRKRRPRSA